MRTFCLLASTLFVLCLAATPALAGVPKWTIASNSSPTNLTPGDESGEQAYVLTVVNSGSSSSDGSRIEVTDTLPGGIAALSISGEDRGNGQPLTCQTTPVPSCAYEGVEVAPGDVLEVRIGLSVEAGALSPATNRATVTGGGAVLDAGTEDPTTISSMQAGFGVAGFQTALSSTQAGEHANLTSVISFDQVETAGEVIPAAEVKDFELELPPGFVVSPRAASLCSTGDAAKDACQGDSAVGVVFTTSGGGGVQRSSSLVYDVVPSPGSPGELEFDAGGQPVFLRMSIDAEHEYRVRLIANNLTQVAPLLSLAMTLQAGSSFLTNPSACSSSSATDVRLDSWSQPETFQSGQSSAGPLQGCQAEPFGGTVTVSPDVTMANTPSGYTVDLRMPATETLEGVSSSEPRELDLAIPGSFSISTLNGLEDCSEVEVALHSSDFSTCPQASKVGSVQIGFSTLANPLEGAIYMASPQSNPSGSLLAVYLVADGSGVQLKLAGELKDDPVTGVTSLILREVPPLPIEEIRLHLFGGARALLATPSSCGRATATSELTPWSGQGASAASAELELTSCAEVFEPSLSVGASGNPNGTDRSLALVVSNPDDDIGFHQLALGIPTSVAQALAAVPPCSEDQAQSGACPATSRVGRVAFAAGLGPTQIYPEGSVYLTGPYHGSQAGLVIAVPFASGPFELGTVVVRAALQSEAVAGQANIVLDPIPASVEGIPLWLDKVELELTAGEFSVNPTTCQSFSVSATVLDTGGASASAFAPLAPAGCVAAGVESPSLSPPSAQNTTKPPMKATHKPKAKARRCPVKKSKSKKKPKKPRKCKAPKHAKAKHKPRHATAKHKAKKHGHMKSSGPKSRS